VNPKRFKPTRSQSPFQSVTDNEGKAAQPIIDADTENMLQKVKAVVVQIVEIDVGGVDFNVFVKCHELIHCNYGAAGVDKVFLPFGEGED
jgi:hypothetical protein